MRDERVERIVDALHALSSSWPDPRAPWALRISSAIAYYDALVAGATGNPCRSRPPSTMLRQRPIWYVFELLLDLCDEMGTDPRDYLRAQFSEFVGDGGELVYPYPPMLTSETALWRWARWQQKHQRRYVGSLQDARRIDEIKASDVAALLASLEAGHTRWQRLIERNRSLEPLVLAQTAAGVVPGVFFLAFAEVREALEFGVFTNAGLRDELLRLGRAPGLLRVLRQWARDKGYDSEDRDSEDMDG